WVRFAVFALLMAGGGVWAQAPNRYIVELSTEAVAEHMRSVPGGLAIPGPARMRGPEATVHRARGRSGQAQIRRNFGTDAKVLGGVDTVANALFVETSEAEAGRIRALPGVRRVMPVREQKLLLDRAVMLHRAVDVWNRTGPEQAGRGIKIAI